MLHTTPQLHDWRHGQAVTMHLVIAAASLGCFTWRIAELQDPVLMPGAAAYECGWPGAAATYAAWPAAASLVTKLAYFVRNFIPLWFYTHICHWGAGAAAHQLATPVVVMAVHLLRLRQQRCMTAVALSWMAATAAYPLVIAMCASPGSGVACSDYTRPSPAMCPPCSSIHIVMHVSWESEGGGIHSA